VRYNGGMEPEFVRAQTHATEKTDC